MSVTMYHYDFISIGIICRNEEKTLPVTLSYIFDQTYPIKKFCEIIIADGNSTDCTKELAKALLIKSGISHKILNERNFKDPLGVGYGHSRGRNVVLMHIDQQSKYVAWIDADCRADKNRLMNLWNTIKDNKDENIVGAGGTRFVETQGDIGQKEIVLNYYFTSNIISLGNPAFTAKPNIVTIPSVAGYNSIFKKEIFDHNRYDTTYPFNTDDLELNFRLTKQGYRFLYAKDATIYHRGETSLSGFLKQMFNYGKGVAYTMRIHQTAFVRLYAWIGVGYVVYTLLLPLLIGGFLSYSLHWRLPLLPYMILLLVGLAVFMENYKKTNNLISIIVIPTLFTHVRYYGWGVLQGLLEKKKTVRGKR